MLEKTRNSIFDVDYDVQDTLTLSNENKENNIYEKK